MLKHNNALDELISYQEKQSVPHGNLMRNGTVPYPVRQLTKQPKKAALLYLMILPGLLVVVAGTLIRFLDHRDDMGLLVTCVLSALAAVVFVIVMIGNVRKAKKLQQMKNETRNRRRKSRKRK